MLGPLCLNLLILQMVTTGLHCSVLRLTYLRISKDEPVKICMVDWHPFSAVLKVMPGVCGLELMGKQKNLTSLHQNIYQEEQVNGLGGEAGLFCHCHHLCLLDTAVVLSPADCLSTTLSRSQPLLTHGGCCLEPDASTR